MPTTHAESPSSVGQWTSDAAGLPVFHLLHRATAETLPAPYTILGNHGITAFFDTNGRLQLHTGERSWACLNGSMRQRETFHEIVLEHDGEALDLCAESLSACRFGCGYAALDYSLDGLELSRTASLPPSRKTGERLPVVFITLKVHNTSDKVQKLRWQEAIGARYNFSFGHNFPFHKNRVDYPPKVETRDKLLSARFEPQSDMPLVLAEGNEPAWQEPYPPTVYLMSRDDAATLSHTLDADGRTAWLRHEMAWELEPGASAEAVFAIGYGQADLDWLATVEGLGDATDFSTEWSRVLPELTDTADAELAREMRWHSYVLHAMATYSAWYEETFVPQGTVYEYALGCSAVIRDHLQHAMPLCYSDHALAASILRFTGKHTDPWGHIRHGDEGANQHPLGPDQKSDSQIYALYTLAEYLIAGNDPALLSEPIHFLASPRQTDLLDCATRWFRYLRDEIKTGPHGLVRLCCSDWNDCFYEFFSNLSYHEIFSIGESSLNSTMAVVALQRLADALEAAADAPALALRKTGVLALIEAARAYRAELLEAVLREMEGRDFITRGYVGKAAIGDKEMFFEPQPWLLMIPELKDRHADIWKAIRERVWESEPCGARQRETPGSRENGGIWFALNGPLVQALAGYDADAAREALEKLTCRRRAETWPERWVGQWSTGDSVNSSRMKDREAAGSIAAYLFPAPVFCAHAHAWPLHGWHTLRAQKS